MHRLTFRWARKSEGAHLTRASWPDVQILYERGLLSRGYFSLEQIEWFYWLLHLLEGFVKTKQYNPLGRFYFIRFWFHSFMQAKLRFNIWLLQEDYCIGVQDCVTTFSASFKLQSMHEHEMLPTRCIRKRTVLYNTYTLLQTGFSDFEQHQSFALCKRTKKLVVLN